MPIETMTPKVVYNIDDDPSPEITEIAVRVLWEDRRYTKQNLKNIALLLLEWVERNN
jgi:hypothetical protein